MSSETQPPDKAATQRETDIYDLLAWLEVNKRKVASIVLVLVLLGLIMATVRHFNEQREIAASSELLALKTALVPPTNQPPPQASRLMEVAQKHRGTAAAERARILAATVLFTDGKYSEAEAEFSRFLQDHPGSLWAAQAALGVATAKEAQNKTNEAQAGYQGIVSAYPNSAVVDDAKLASARIFESAQQPEQALRLYNELLAPKPGAQAGAEFNEEAERRKEELLRAHPHLNTNTPPVAAALPSISMTNTAATTIRSAPLSNAAPSALPTNVVTLSPVLSTNAPAATATTNVPPAK